MNQTLSLEPGDTSFGWTVISSQDLPEIDGRAYVVRHEASGARLLYLQNDDENKAFSISFKTPPVDDTGVFHILEHSVLCGSGRFPVKEPFVNLLKTSMQTFLNALTYPDKTMYPVASTNEQDLMNLMDVYLDAVLDPAIYADRRIFEQEGWHYELAEDEEGAEGAQATPRLEYNGVVFNEMKGALSDPEGVLFHELNRALFPKSCYAYESGGHPRSIPQLTYEGYLDTHARHYNLRNSYLVIYGDLDAARVLSFLDGRFASGDYDRPADSPAQAWFSQAGEPNPMGDVDAAPQGDAVREAFMDTAPENACVGLGYVVGHSRDFERVLAADVLMDALMGGNESPIKRAVLDAGIGGDCTAYLMDSQARPAAMFVLRNAKPGSAETFRAIVEGEAARLAREGIPRDVLEASLSQLAFDLRERDRGIADGVALAMNALSGWLYDEDCATTYLSYEEPLAHMRAGLESRYFEDVLASLVVDNPRRACVDLVAQPGFGAGEEEAELAGAAAVMGEEDFAAIAADVASLRARQEAPDTPEGLATLPQLHLSDIGPAKPDPAPQPLDAAHPCVLYEMPTRNICYLYGFFDLRGLAFEDLPYAMLLSMLLGSLDTAEHTAAELDSYSRSHLGALRFFVDSHVNCADADDLTVHLTVSASALSEELESLAAIPREVWETTSFADTGRIRDRLVQRRVAMEQSFMAEGHAKAMCRAAAGLFRSGVLSEQLMGVEFYRFLCDLIDHFDERAEKLASKLEEVRGKVFAGRGFQASFTGSRDDAMRFWRIAGDWGLTGGPLPERVLEIPAPKPACEAFCVPSDVVYVAKAADVREVSREGGYWSVASKALTLDRLWNEVRVKGGAYGCGFARTSMGLARFYSYRDPRIDETLTRFDEAAEWLAAFEPAPDEMEGYIVSTVAGHDAPVKPRLVARRQDAARFAGRPQGYRERLRDEILATTPELVRSLAPALEEVARSGLVCVFGSREIIERAGVAFDTVEQLL